MSGGNYGAAPGVLEGWKESGGFAGTFSPNAAFVQTVIPVKAATIYTVTLEWKANHATGGTIFAAAGLGPQFSPTRLTAELVPGTDPSLHSVYSSSQYTLTGSNGSTWQDLDPSALSINFTPAASGSAVLSANADLWTQNAGVNQDIGIFVSGGAFGTGQIVGWKESGGFAGTFSPNAAFAQTVVQFVAATPYVIKLEWKTNHTTTGTIWAAAGLSPNFSPTRLTVRLFPAGSGLQDAAPSAAAPWSPGKRVAALPAPFPQRGLRPDRHSPGGDDELHRDAGVEGQPRRQRHDLRGRRTGPGAELLPDPPDRADRQLTGGGNGDRPEKRGSVLATKLR